MLQTLHLLIVVINALNYIGNIPEMLSGPSNGLQLHKQNLPAVTITPAAVSLWQFTKLSIENHFLHHDALSSYLTTTTGNFLCPKQSQQQKDFFHGRFGWLEMRQSTAAATKLTEMKFGELK